MENCEVKYMYFSASEALYQEPITNELLKHTHRPVKKVHKEFFIQITAS